MMTGSVFWEKTLTNTVHVYISGEFIKDERFESNTVI